MRHAGRGKQASAGEADEQWEDGRRGGQKGGPCQVKPCRTVIGVGVCSEDQCCLGKDQQTRLESGRMVWRPRQKVGD